MGIFRKATNEIKIGNLRIGNKNRIAIQSMTNTKTTDFEETFNQIKKLENAGCDIVRLAVPSIDAAEVFYQLKNKGIKLPLVADIHFDYRIAVKCIEYGADKIRINPGNIGDEERIATVVQKAKSANIPIRIGVNSGSLEKHILAKYGSPTSEALAESAIYHVQLLEKYDFNDIVIAVKSSDVPTMINANRVLSAKYKYPLHLGVTEAGTLKSGIIKSSIGIGSLLCDGIGDTIRVSLTSDPVDEVIAAKQILSSLSLYDQSKISTVSCPTCGRTRINLIEIANKFDEIKDTLTPSKKIKVAIMGCVVNGPGEATEADIGIAGGVNEAVLFKKGQIIKKIPEEDILKILCDEINCL